MNHGVMSLHSEPQRVTGIIYLLIQRTSKTLTVYSLIYITGGIHIVGCYKQAANSDCFCCLNWACRGGHKSVTGDTGS
jgi:hypothetical protein